MAEAHQQNEAWSRIIQSIERGKVLTPQEVQGHSRLAWQLNSQFKSLHLDG